LFYRIANKHLNPESHCKHAKTCNIALFSLHARQKHRPEQKNINHVRKGTVLLSAHSVSFDFWQKSLFIGYIEPFPNVKMPLCSQQITFS
jgi:hypothetical protein